MQGRVPSAHRSGDTAASCSPRSRVTTAMTLNKKVKRLAMKSALSSKVLDNEIIVLDKIALDAYKTKDIVAMLKAIGSEKKALIVLPRRTKR